MSVTDGEWTLVLPMCPSMLPMKFVPPGFAPITVHDLDDITPELDGATIDDLAFRLMGLCGNHLELECIQLVGAMLDDMNALGYKVGRLEHVVVLALMRAAVAKMAWTQVGRA